jgi:CDP-glycerol glycerophosphotransferase (TagB/SpsB family)
MRCSYLFSEIYKDIKLLKKIIKKENPKEIIFGYYTNHFENNFLLEDNDNSIYWITKEIIKNKKIKLINLNFKEKIIQKRDKLFSRLLSKIQNKLLFSLKLSKNKKVLLIGSRNQFSNIIASLRAMNYTTIRGGSDSGLSLLKNGGDYYITFRYFINKVIKKNLFRAKILLNEYYKQLRAKKDFKKSFIYDKINYWKIFEQKLKFLYKKEFLNVIKNVEIINFLYNKNYFDLIVVSNDINTFEKTLVIATKNLNKKSLVIQHGATTHPVSFLPLKADYICAWGKLSKAWLMQQGKINKNRIMATGCSRFDSYFSPCKLTKKEVYKSFNIPEKKKIILYAPPFHHRYGHFPNFQLNIDEISEVYKEIFSNMKNLKDYHLLIKLHPSDKLVKLPKQVAKEIKFEDYSMIQDFDIHSLLNAAEMVITSWSTVGYEAMLLNKPVIVLDLTKDRRSENGNYVKYNAAIGVYKKSILYKVINKISQENKFKDNLIKNAKIFLKKSLHKLDGKSSDRIAMSIKDIINKRS